MLLKKLNKKTQSLSKDVERTAQEYLAFCKEFIHYSNQETLIVLVLDKDMFNKSFLDYAFESGAKEIVKCTFITQLIENMWDQSRLIKSSLMSYSALYQLDNLHHFSYYRNFQPIKISNGFTTYQTIDDIEDHEGSKQQHCFCKCKRKSKCCKICYNKPLTNTQKENMLDLAKNSKNCTSISYTCYNSSVMYRILMDIICTALMSIIECIVVFDIERFYDVDKDEFHLHESHWYRPNETIFITVLRSAFLVNIFMQTVV